MKGLIAGTNKSVALYSACGLAVGVLLLWLAARDGAYSLNPTWQSVFSNMGGVVVATTLISAAWELFGKRSLASEVMAMANLGADIQKSGIQHVTDAYLDTVPWDDLMTGATKVDIVVAYASTWRNAHWSRLEQLAANPKAQIRVFLPDPGDPQTMRLLSERFGKKPPEVRTKVEEAISEFGRLRGTGGADLSIHVRKGDLVFSCYRFDGQAVLTLYSHSRERRSNVPTFVVKTGSLWQFVHDEIEVIAAQSAVALPSPPRGAPE
ncbi:hypothetical protein [Nocardioides alkalitolerans]|uniref:hypothetical protein n=1 Tax=Nocardioides alkalitolerans TaxID=281714 RepID=UPI0012F8C356|nr:hypothetical protein [Nocardioides alkalitolerans]